MVSTRFLTILLACCVLLFASCNKDGQQTGEAAAQDPRYEEVAKLADSPQWYYFTEFTGNKPKNTDSIKFALRALGEGQYVQYELYNEYLNPNDQLELDVLESFIDTGDTIQRQKVRDQKFIKVGEDLSLSRFDTKGISVQEIYEVPVGDSLYSVYNIFGYAHQGDYTPTHRIFWTQEFGSFFIWYGEWNSLELTHAKLPVNDAALLALRAEVRKLVAIPFPPLPGPITE